MRTHVVGRQEQVSDLCVRLRAGGEGSHMVDEQRFEVRHGIRVGEQYVRIEEPVHKIAILELR